MAQLPDTIIRHVMPCTDRDGDIEGDEDFPVGVFDALGARFG